MNLTNSLYRLEEEGWALASFQRSLIRICSSHLESFFLDPRQTVLEFIFFRRNRSFHFNFLGIIMHEQASRSRTQKPVVEFWYLKHKKINLPLEFDLNCIKIQFKTCFFFGIFKNFERVTYCFQQLKIKVKWNPELPSKANLPNNT